MRVPNLIVAAAILAFASASQAQLTFSGPATFGSAFSSGTLTPAAIFTVTSPASGINLAGDFYVTVPSGTTTGNLLQWYVDRPISGVSGPFSITTSLTGFTSLTVGSNSGGGVLVTEIYNGGSIVAGTQCVTQFSYSGALTTFSQFNTITPIYSYTAGDTLRLYYDTTVNYSGTGGVFDVNFPAEAIITAVPEPTSALLMVIGMGALGMRRRRL